MSNPFVAGPAIEIGTTTTDQELPTFKEYAWDFAHSCFRYNSEGKQIEVTENEALKVWVYKLLKIQRFRHLAYYDDYGIILDEYIGKSVNDGANASTLFTDIKEAIMVNPYIKSVVNTGLNQGAGTTLLALELETIYGELQITVEV